MSANSYSVSAVRHYPLRFINYYDSTGKWIGYEAVFDITKHTSEDSVCDATSEQ